MGREDWDSLRKHRHCFPQKEEKIKHGSEYREILKYVFPNRLNSWVKIKSQWLKWRGGSWEGFK